MEIDDDVTQYLEDPPLWMGMGVEIEEIWRIAQPEKQQEIKQQTQ
jgi:hypothetical protein